MQLTNILPVEISVTGE